MAGHSERGTGRHDIAILHHPKETTLIPANRLLASRGVAVAIISCQGRPPSTSARGSMPGPSR